MKVQSYSPQLSRLFSTTLNLLRGLGHRVGRVSRTPDFQKDFDTLKEKLVTATIFIFLDWPQLILPPNLYHDIIRHHSKLGRGQIKRLVLIQEYFLLFHLFLLSHHSPLLYSSATNSLDLLQKCPLFLRWEGLLLLSSRN